MTDETVRPCSKCKVVQPVSCFQFQNGRPSGQCRSCKTEAERQRRINKGIPVKPLSEIVGHQKRCVQCRELKDFNCFYSAKRGLGGLAAYCKECFRDKFHPSKEQIRSVTAKYRERNRDRWRAKHRIHQYKRRTLKDAQTDGTVTDDFLERLYGTSTCFYCSQETVSSDRTADHVIPLSKGGLHSAANLVMACRSCNSAKRNLMPDDFKEYMNDNIRKDYTRQYQS